MMTTPDYKECGFFYAVSPLSKMLLITEEGGRSKLIVVKRGEGEEVQC
jgi:hypothetical protein